ncbi:hypothetical protein K1719_019612 [Acacia pycnantha]|nr:hypothetical protein K1719_019612 [Acacia pycnantha]
MKIAPPLTLLLLAFFFIPLHNSILVASDTKTITDHDSGYIGIDCGVEEAYQDSESNLRYKPDADFVESGQNHRLPSDYSFSKSQMSKQLNTLRSFPDGDRNCYTLSPKQGRNNKYIVRAFFAYGNYDLNNKIPIFDLYLGVNRWKTTELDITPYYSVEVILVAPTDIISVCLVNTGNGVPFISSLELWLLGDYTYPISSLPLDLLTRSTPGRLGDDKFIRYP